MTERRRLAVRGEAVQSGHIYVSRYDERSDDRPENDVEPGKGSRLRDEDGNEGKGNVPERHPDEPDDRPKTAIRRCIRISA